jgi:hypothetical protein
VPAVKSIAQQLLAPLAFGLAIGLFTILRNYHGAAQLVLAMIAGAALMVSLQAFAADVRRRSNTR